MGKVSEAQKGYQKKYDQKTKMVSVKYTPADMADYERMTAYLERTGQSTNSFIKKLVNAFFENGESTKVAAFEEEFYDRCVSWISEEDMKNLKMLLDEEQCNFILKSYVRTQEDNLELELEGEAEKFGDWLNSILPDETDDQAEADEKINLFNKHGKEFEKAIEDSMTEYGL